MTIVSIGRIRMKKIAFLTITLLFTFGAEAKCVLDKAAVGQDIDLSELGEELLGEIQAANPACRFSTQRECEGFTDLDLFNRDRKPCKWISGQTEPSPGTEPEVSTPESSEHPDDVENGAVLTCKRTVNNQIVCNDDMSYRLIPVDPTTPEMFKVLVNRLERINRGKQLDIQKNSYWPIDDFTDRVEKRRGPEEETDGNNESTSSSGVTRD